MSKIEINASRESVRINAEGTVALMIGITLALAAAGAIAYLWFT